MKPKSALRSFLLAAGSSLVAISSAHAADGTWTQTTAGPFNWGDTANWNSGSGPIASGQDSTAFFTADLSATQTVTLNSNRTLGTLVFEDLVSSHNLTILGANILTLDRATGVPVINVAQSDRTLTINSQISGGDGLRKIGLGSLTLGGTNDYTGGTFLSGGTLTLANTSSLTSGSALTFDSTATFNSIRLASGGQTLGTLTLNSGDATITSTAAGASSAATLTFGSLATRSVGATANFTLATNTTASTNKIVFSSTTNVPLASGSNDAGIFFGGSTYARYDAAGYVRAIIYGGADSNTNAALSGLQTTLGTISGTTDVRFNAAATTTSTASAQAAASTLTVADGTLFRVGQAISGTNITGNTYITGISGNLLTLNQNTGTVAASAVITPYTLVTGQTTGSVNTVLLSGAGASIRLGDTQTLSVNGILRSGGTANVISTITGGTGIQTATSGGELVLRTDVANDVVRVTTPILDNGGSSLTKSGAGTLTLTGNNTYTGSTTVNGGFLNMTGSNAYSGGTVINAGTLTISGDSALGDVNGGITFNGNGSLLVSAATTLASTRTITLNNGAIPYLGDININSSTTLIINGKITGTGGIQASHYTLGGSTTVAATRLASTANDFTGPVILGGNPNATYSAFVLETASLADSAGAGNIIFQNGRNTAGDSATFQWGAGAITGLTLNHRQLEIATTGGTNNVISGVSNINATAANTVVINTDLKVSTTSARTFQLGGTNTGANTFAGKIVNGVGAIGLNKSGGGNWNVTNTANSFTGGTTVSSGILGFSNGALGSSGTINASGGTLLWLTGNSQDISGRLAMTLATTTTLNTNGNAVTFATAIGNSNTSALTKTGLGTLTLNAANTYTGRTSVNDGTLNLGFGTVTSNIISSSSALTLGNGTLQLSGAATSTQTLNGLTTTASTGSRILLAADKTLTLGALTIGASSALNFNTAAGGADAATTTVGTSIVTGTGGTILNSWTVTDSTGFGLAARNGSNQIIRATAATLLPASGATSGNNYRINNNAGGGAAAGSSALAVTADQAASSVTVDTTDASGVLTLNSGVQISTNTWNFGNGSGTNTYQITGSAGGAGVQSAASGNTITINNYNAGAVTFTSPILASGTNPVIFNGTGTTVVEGANTYTGATTVNGGTLVIDGSTHASSAVSVGASGTLGGTGTINGTLALTGILAPGSAGVVDIETLNAGTTTWNGGSIWNFDLAAAAGSSDQLAITGNFTKGTGTGFVFNFMGSAPNAYGNAYTLASWSGTTSFLASDFTFTGLTGSYTNGTFAITGGNTLQFTAIPEPTSALAGLLLTAGLLRRRRK